LAKRDAARTKEVVDLRREASGINSNVPRWLRAVCDKR